MPRTTQSKVVSELDAARIAYDQAREALRIARAADATTLQSYLIKSVSYLSRLQEISSNLSIDDVTEAIGALEKLAGITSRYENKQSRSRLSHSLQSASAYENMTPGQKAAYTRRMNKLKAQSSHESATTSYEFTAQRGRAARQQAGYTRNKLAGLLKMSQSYLALIESDNVNVADAEPGSKAYRYREWFNKQSVIPI